MSNTLRNHWPVLIVAPAATAPPGSEPAPLYCMEPGNLIAGQAGAGDIHSLRSLDSLHGHCHGFAAADAERGEPDLLQEPVDSADGRQCKPFRLA